MLLCLESFATFLVTPRQPSAGVLGRARTFPGRVVPIEYMCPSRMSILSVSTPDLEPSPLCLKVLGARKHMVFVAHTESSED